MVAERTNAVVRIKHLIAQQRPLSRGGWRQALDSSAFSGASRTLFFSWQVGSSDGSWHGRQPSRTAAFVTSCMIALMVVCDQVS